MLEEDDKMNRVSHETLMNGQLEIRHLIERTQDTFTRELQEVRKVAEKGVDASHKNTESLAAIGGQLTALQDYRVTGSDWSERVDARLGLLEIAIAQSNTATKTYGGILSHPLFVQIFLQIVTLAGVVAYLQSFGVKHS